LTEALSLLGMEDWRVRIDFGDNAPIVVVSRGGKAAFADANGDVDVTLTMSPKIMVQILELELPPRLAITSFRITMEGDTKLGTRFCDALLGRRVANTLATPNPLPTPTTDWELAKDQMDEFGYAILKDALPPMQLARVRKRLLEQAQAERELGIACMDGGVPGTPNQPNQRVWNLPNKGREFIELLDHPLIDFFVPDLLGDYFLLSNHTANIAGPGGRPMNPHIDQSHSPVDLAMGMNVMWFLGDVTAANGGTRVLPGSHKPGVVLADVFSIDETIPVEAPAGSAFLFDARLLHGTGANVTMNEKRPVIISLFTRSWDRQADNATVSLADDVFESLSDRVKTMFGFRVTNYRGTVEGQTIGDDGIIINRHFKRVRELKPKGAPAD
jgi:ectoine hydroxylase-related dioxygenase (phytanoyl-CoA dioxygenase family)